MLFPYQLILFFRNFLDQELAEYDEWSALNLHITTSDKMIFAVLCDTGSAEFHCLLILFSTCRNQYFRAKLLHKNVRVVLETYSGFSDAIVGSFGVPFEFNKTECETAAIYLLDYLGYEIIVLYSVAFFPFLNLKITVIWGFKCVMNKLSGVLHHTRK